MNVRHFASRIWEQWLWVSQITSLIGIISILDDLKSWAALLASIIRSMGNIIPQLPDILGKLAIFLHQVAEIWRAVVHPAFLFLFGWTGLHFSPMQIDVICVTFLLTLSIARSIYLRLIARRRHRSTVDDLIRIRRNSYSTFMGSEGGARLSDMSEDRLFEYEGDNEDISDLRISYNSAKSQFLKRIRTSDLVVAVTVIVAIGVYIFLFCDYLYFGSRF